PFDSIEFIEDGKAVRFRVGDTTWKCDLSSYECSRSDQNPMPAPADEPADRTDEEVITRQESPWPDGLSPDGEQDQARQPQPPRPPERTERSPDGNWTAFVKDGNVMVRNREGKETQLSQDGKADQSYGLLTWAPDAKTLVAFRIEPGDNKEVYLIESSPSEGGRAKLHTRPYPLPGDKF